MLGGAAPLCESVSDGGQHKPRSPPCTGVSGDNGGDGRGASPAGCGAWGQEAGCRGGASLTVFST